MAGSYQALYRKWRPMTFDDVVGQKHVSDTLKTGIASGRIAHAYLFCGTRGTGKTSTAKIFSRAVNCQSPVNGEPCNECDSCRGILDGSILDVYEMDAASNRGVDNIREIRDEVAYTPAGCTYKVYIIDEVHMLTKEAFNALLKTLEEPPGHAIFILATTEPHKIPTTVLSRCQRFDFRRIGVGDISERIFEIIKAENISADDDAVQLIAELGDGSMRDALSILDQCAAFGYDNLTRELVTDIVGIADPKMLMEVAAAIAEGDTKTALIKTETLLKQGKEVQNFIEELTAHFRNLLICKATDNPAELLEKTDDAAEKFKEQAELFSTEQILYSVRLLGDSLAQAKRMSAPQIAAETAIVKLCNPEYSTEPDAVLARIGKLEKMISRGVTVSAKQVEKPSDSNEETIEDAPPWDVPKEEKETEVVAVNEEPVKEKAEKTGTEEIWEHWADALQEIKGKSVKLFAFLYSGKAFLVGNTVEIELATQMAYDRIATPNGIAYLEELFSGIAKENLNVKVFIEGSRKGEENSESGIENLAKKKDLFGGKINIK